MSRLDSRRLIRRHIREVRTEGDTYIWLSRSGHVAVLQPATEEIRSKGTSLGLGVACEDKKIVVRDTTQAGTDR